MLTILLYIVLGYFALRIAVGFLQFLDDAWKSFKYGGHKTRYPRR